MRSSQLARYTCISSLSFGGHNQSYREQVIQEEDSSAFCFDRGRTNDQNRASESDVDLVVVGPIAAVSFTAPFATTVKRSGTTKISNQTPKFNR